VKHQRSHSYHADFQNLSVEERRLARNAMRTFSEAMQAAGEGRPEIPEWLDVRRTPYSKTIWQMKWDMHGVAGRATFTLVRLNGELTIRWLRVSAPRTAQAVPSAASALDDLKMVAQANAEAAKVIEDGDVAGPHDTELGIRALPSAANLIAFTRNKRGETIYLERKRWDDHILPNHVTTPPQMRGKSTTTWWPVMHTATGYRSMTEEQVIDLTMEACREGHWQNAPRGTRLCVYHLPDQEAQILGVSEVKVSTAPDGRILSSYPTAGSNVLAVKELAPEDYERHNAVPYSPPETSPTGSFDSATGWDG
jgi:hypothetical protein